MKTCFSEGRLMKQFGNPPFSKRTRLSTNPPFSEQFFHDPLLVQISKTRPPPTLISGWRGNYERVVSIKKKQGVSHSQKFRGKCGFPDLVNSKTS